MWRSQVRVHLGTESPSLGNALLFNVRLSNRKFSFSRALIRTSDTEWDIKKKSISLEAFLISAFDEKIEGEKEMVPDLLLYFDVIKDIHPY